VNSYRKDGVLFLDSSVRLSDIRDGTSNTLMVGERPPSPDFILGWWYAGWGMDQTGSGDAVLGVRAKNNGEFAPDCPQDHTASAPEGSPIHARLMASGAFTSAEPTFCSAMEVCVRALTKRMR